MVRNVLVLLSMFTLCLGRIVSIAIMNKKTDGVTEMFSVLKSHPSVDVVMINVSQYHENLLYQEALWVRNMNKQQTYLLPEETCNQMSLIAQYEMKTQSVTCFKSRDCTFNPVVYLPIVQYSTSINSVVQYVGWSDILIITDDQLAANSLCMELSTTGVSCSIVNFNSSSDVQAMLHLISLQVFPWQFLLLTNISTAVQVLHEVDSFDVRNRRRTDIRSSSQWLVIVREGTLDMFHMDIWVDNIAVIVYPTVSIETVILKSSADNRQGEIFTLMYRQSGRELVHIGRCNPDGQINVNSEIFPNSRFGLNGRLFTVSTMRWLPYTLTRNESGKTVYEGICIDILRELSKVMNFTYRLIQPLDLEWGLKDSAGNYTGLVGQIQRNEIDMTAAALALSRDRVDVMDFSYPFGFDYGVGIYKLPDSDSDRWSTLIRPFSWSVHLLIAVAVVVCTLSLYALRWWHSLSGRESSLSDTWLVMLGLFIRHSPDIRSGSISSSFLISFIGLFGTMIAAIYCGNMIAFLTVSKQTLPFTTLPEVTKQTTYTWGTLGGSLWPISFELSKDPDHITFWQGIMKFNKTDPGILHSSEFVQKAKVKRGHYVFVVESDILRAWTQEDCRLKLLSDSLYPMRYALGLPLHSPYRKVISNWIMLFYERGLLDVWRKKWLNVNDKCATQMSVKGTSIALIDLQSAFYLLTAGIAAAVVAVVVERKLIAVFK